MNAPKTSPDQAPGHDGAGYGEQVPAGAPSRTAPQTDAEAATATAPAVAVDTGTAPAGTAGAIAPDDGAPVVFTPDDVSAKPPDHPPTENAPESEKAGLIFERS